ncbi:DUF5381 family protein [Metabacillus sp. 84]|uniref:DUF5381 family protein n=1 Tax=unclassified Metabacillus TaxID=2675274 RepID=UPI003CF6D8AC
MKQINQTDTIEVKANPRLVGFGLAAIAVAILVCGWLMIDAFNSGLKTSLLGLAGGVLGTFLGLYFLIHSGPVFFGDKVLFKIIPGPDGRIESKKQSVPLRDIKDITVQHGGMTLRSWLYYDLVILTKQNKKIRIPTYNVLNDQEFNSYKRDYILPYLNHEQIRV